MVILLDHSYSMAYGDQWPRAQAAARSVVQNLGADDRATLILFGTGAELDVRSTIDRGRLLAGIDAATISAQATRYTPALKLAQRVLVESRLPRREVIMISDFQRNGWIQDDSLRLPEGGTFTPVAVTSAAPSNITVSSAMLQRTTFSGQERVTVSAGLVNRGASAVNNLEVRLEVDGRSLEAQRVTVSPGAPASVAFQPFTLARPFTRGTVRVAADQLVWDDALHFVVSPAQRLPVLLVQSSRAARDASLFLTRALSIGTTPTFQVEAKQAEQVSSADLERARVVILNDTALTGSGTALARFVERGGGLFAILGERAVWGRRRTACYRERREQSSTAPRDEAAHWPSSTTAIPYWKCSKRLEAGIYRQRDSSATGVSRWKPQQRQRRRQDRHRRREPRASLLDSMTATSPWRNALSGWGVSWCGRQRSTTSGTIWR